MISIQYSKFYKKKNEHTEEEEEDDDNPNGNDKKEFVFLCVDCRVQKSVGMTHQPPPTSIWRSIAGGGNSSQAKREMHNIATYSARRLDLLSNDLCRGGGSRNILLFFPSYMHYPKWMNGESLMSLA